MSKHRYLFLVVLSFVLVIFLGACSASKKNFHFRLDVEAIYGGKAVSGSGVLMQPLILSSQGYTRGEAITIDLGNGKNAYLVLIERQNFSRVFFGAVYNSFAPLLKGKGDVLSADEFKASVFSLPNGTRAEWKYKKTRPDPRGQLYGYPLVVAFEDDADPTSVFLVETEKPTLLFGKTFDFGRIHLEKVSADTPLTNKLINQLPWLDPRHEYWDGAVWITLDHSHTPGKSLPRSEMPFAQLISRKSFRSAER